MMDRAQRQFYGTQCRFEPEGQPGRPAWQSEGIYDLERILTQSYKAPEDKPLSGVGLHAANNGFRLSVVLAAIVASAIVGPVYLTLRLLHFQVHPPFLPDFSSDPADFRNYDNYEEEPLEESPTDLFVKEFSDF